MISLRKITLFSLFLMLLGSQTAKAQAVVVLSEDKNDYTQTADGYILNFDLTATSEELEIIKSNIGSMSDRLSMTTTVVSVGNYECVYTITHQNQPEYVHKMMLASGFQVFVADRIPGTT